MGRVLTNSVGLAYSIEEALGVLASNAEWKQLEPNTIGTLGADITTVARDPISQNRQRRKGTIVDLDSAVEVEMDYILEHFIDFAEGFVFSAFVGGNTYNPSGVTSGASGGYTVTAGGDLDAGTLVFARGFVLPANNGLKLVASGATPTNIRVNGLLDETAPANATVEVTGVRAGVGDIQVNAGGNLVSSVLDFTDLPLSVGQFVWVGGEDDDNRFANDDNRGFARVIAVAPNLLTLDKKSQVFVADTGTGKQIDLYFGRFLRNVPVSDMNFLERSFQFEGSYPNLDEPGPGDRYEYAKGNLCNTLAFTLPLTDKATMNAAFIGTDTQPPTTARATNASNAKLPLQTTLFNTTADVARLRITEVDETGLTTDFKSVTLTLNNNVTPEKVIGRLGAKYMNYGNFDVDLEAQLLFTDGAVLEAIRENRTLALDFALRNTDGAVVTDIPSLTLGGGAKELPRNESVLLNTTAMAFGDPVFGYSIGFSLFPFVPSE